MLLFAVTGLEKLQAVPLKIWINLTMGLLIVIAAIIVLRKAAEMNKILLSVIIFVVVTSVGFNWVYSRNEPKFMSPLIDRIAAFFPSGGANARKDNKNIPDN